MQECYSHRVINNSYIRGSLSAPRVILCKSSSRSSLQLEDRCHESEENWETRLEAHAAAQADLEHQLADIQEGTGRHRCEADAAAATAAADIETNRTASAALEQQLQQARSEADALRAEVTAANASAATFAAAASAAKQEAQHLAIELADSAAARGDAPAAEAAAAAARSERAEAVAAAAAIGAEVEVLRSERVAMDRELQQLQSSAEDAAAHASDQIAKLTSESEESLKRAELAEQEQRTLVAEVDRLRVQREAQADAQRDASDRIAALEQQHLERESVLSATSSQVHQLQASWVL